MSELSIRETFSGKSILITGASGFVGSILIEKLLRECQDITKIYLLFRSKKGDNLEKRFEKFLQSILFTKIKEKDETLLQKLEPIYGDLLESPNAGIQEQDIKILEANVNFVIHCAASIRFDEPLKRAVTLNTIGTKTMLDLAENFQNLEAFVHVSTAYSNSNLENIDEVLYEPILDYKLVIKACENNDIDEIQRLEKIALQTFPNTYIFTKNITEKLVSDRNNIPKAIVRPSIVTPVYKDPIPGYCDSVINGPIGVLMGASLGVLRSVHARGHIVPDLIPADYCVNSIIATCAYVANNPKEKMKIINCTSSAQNPITWRSFLDLGREVYADYPSTNAVWYPGGRMCRFYIVYLTRFIFLQLLPSLFLDFCLIIVGKKPGFTKLQKKIFVGLGLFNYFLDRQWHWKNDNMLMLFNQLADNDKQTFGFDTTQIDYREYLTSWVIGVRRYIGKLPDDTLPAAKWRYRILFVLDFIVKIIFYAITSFIFYKIFNQQHGLLECNKCNRNIFNIRKIY